MPVYSNLRQYAMSLGMGAHEVRTSSYQHVHTRVRLIEDGRHRSRSSQQSSSSGSSSQTASGQSSSTSSSSSSSAYVDRDEWSDLKDAAATGRGITRAELEKIVREHARDGQYGVLTKGERNALRRAVDRGMFAHPSTSTAAAKLARGEPLSVIGIRRL